MLCSVRPCPRCGRDAWRENAPAREPGVYIRSWSCIYCGTTAYATAFGTFIPRPLEGDV